MSLRARVPTIQTLHVADIELPRELEGLYALAYNLWWTWTPSARELFASIDAATWARYRNPVELLINVEPRHWYPLLEDEDFLTRCRRVVGALDEYLASGSCWYDHQPRKLTAPVAYVSMEYGLHKSLAIYSGGLGILSGDHCKSASDLGLPFVAVGLLYRRGYFQQTIDAEGIQQHTYPEYDFSRLPLRPIASATGRELRVELALPGRTLEVKLWLAQVGRVPLILLDTDLPENDPSDRPIADQLYVQGREMRLVQEIVLGMGAAKALAALDIEPSVWHINEGHSAFLQLERLRTMVAGGLDPELGLDRLRATTAFTTHTPVPAGNEQFPVRLVEKYTARAAEQAGLGVERLLALGRGNGDEVFNLTALAIRTAAVINGVSQRNAEVTSAMWRSLFPAGGHQPIRAITNGVHTESWLGPAMRELFERYLGRDWSTLLLEPAGWQAIDEIPDHALWQAHGAQKARLARFARARMRRQMARHGKSPDELRAIDGRFDPHALTIGFARRFATYKRADLLFADRERLRALLAHAERPVQILFAGKAHPADRPGQALIRSIVELSRSERLTGRIFFLENYDMRMGCMLVQGVEVWLNTPRMPLEASGTSGMKAAANGVLNLSILDGWWPEGYDGENGWAIDARANRVAGTRLAAGTDAPMSEAEQDGADAAALYRLLEEEVIPLYYDQDEAGIPRRFVARMRHAIKTLTPAFSADRMVRDYAREAYFPCAECGGALSPPLPLVPAGEQSARP